LENKTPPNLTCLSTSDFFENASDVLVDEHRTLEEAGIRNEDLLVLQIGKMPVKSTSVALHAYLFLPPEPEPAKPAQLPQPNSSSEKIPAEPAQPQVAVNGPAEPESTEPQNANGGSGAGQVEFEMAAFSPALTHQAKNLGKLFLGVVEADHVKSTVDEVKRKIHALEMLSSVPSHQHLRLWHRDKLLKKPNLTINKYFERYDACLTVQTLSIPDPLDTILLYVFHIKHPQAALTAPIEVFVPLFPTVPALRDHIARALFAPSEHLAIAKYYMQNRKPAWKILNFNEEKRDDVAGNLVVKSQRGRRDRRDKRSIVKDGDILGVIDTHENPDSLEYFKRFPPSQKQHHNSHPPLNITHSSAPSKPAKPKVPEAVLKINLDWD